MGLLHKVSSCSFAAMVFFAFMTSCSSSEQDRSIGTDAIDLPFSADDEHKARALPVMTFTTTEVNTGRILQGDIRSFVFDFTNTGKGPLVISDISASCGCTVPRNYPKGKILPGESASIEVEYNSDNKWGEQVSIIAITANTIPNRTELIIRADVVAPNKP